MNDTNKKKLTMLANKLGRQALLTELASMIDNDELENMLDGIADDCNMMFTEDGNELLTFDTEEIISWQELMQDRYPSDENGKIFDTPSGF